MSTDQTFGPWTDVLPAVAPAAHHNLDVNVGARHFCTLTRDHLHYWLTRLPFVSGGPFMTVSRPDHPGFIQTYRNDATNYLLELHPGTEDGHYLSTTIPDLDRVAELIWSWLEQDSTSLDEIDWERCSF